ncbi:MAG: hypothetical protein KDC35_10320 [Acidobacteria bacterium]|nr:hypothetical protein [Acidobacteriota bacterium]
MDKGLHQNILATIKHIPEAKLGIGLKLYESYGGSVFLSPKGELFEFAEYSGSTRKLESREEILTSLAIGSRRYPQLANLLPLRDRDAKICDLCEGEGVVLVGVTKKEIICGKCAGLGWLSNNNG